LYEFFINFYNNLNNNNDNNNNKNNNSDNNSEEKLNKTKQFFNDFKYKYPPIIAVSLEDVIENETGFLKHIFNFLIILNSEVDNIEENLKKFNSHNDWNAANKSNINNNDNNNNNNNFISKNDFITLFFKLIDFNFEKLDFTLLEIYFNTNNKNKNNKLNENKKINDNNIIKNDNMYSSLILQISEAVIVEKLIKNFINYLGKNYNFFDNFSLIEILKINQNRMVIKKLDCLF
jgi:hypothetical protein